MKISGHATWQINIGLWRVPRRRVVLHCCPLSSGGLCCYATDPAASAVTPKSAQQYSSTCGSWLGVWCACSPSASSTAREVLAFPDLTFFVAHASCRMVMRPSFSKWVSQSGGDSRGPSEVENLTEFDGFDGFDGGPGGPPEFDGI